MPPTQDGETENDERRGDGRGDGRVFTSSAARRSAILRTLVLVAGVLGATVAINVAIPQVTDPAWVRARIAAFGLLAPLVFVGVQTVQVIIAPIPGQMLAGVGGYLFGVLPGTAYSLVGVVLGSAVVFTATRRYGRPYVERVVTPEALARWDGFVERNGAPGLFVLFLLPTFPDDVLCFAAGLSELRLRTFLFLVVVGRGPSFLAVVYAGSQLAEGDLWTVALVVTALGLGSLAVYLARDRIVANLERVG